MKDLCGFDFSSQFLVYREQPQFSVTRACLLIAIGKCRPFVKRRNPYTPYNVLCLVTYIAIIHYGNILNAKVLRQCGVY
ncbi:hypothetical protein BDF19DRAFT_448947 [Syncephalis fuscata]|nr:hypothetical protein BDF19DRAFT_448947 [Syncephalis fuscata]